MSSKKMAEALVHRKFIRCTRAKEERETEAFSFYLILVSSIRQKPIKWVVEPKSRNFSLLFELFILCMNVENITDYQLHH